MTKPRGALRRNLPLLAETLGIFVILMSVAMLATRSVPSGWSWSAVALLAGAQGHPEIPWYELPERRYQLPEAMPAMTT